MEVPPKTMATSMATTASIGPENEEKGRLIPILLGPRWKQQLMHKNKSRPFVGATTKPRRAHNYHDDGSVLGDAFHPVLTHPSRIPPLKPSSATGLALFRRYEAFPSTRYRVVQPFREDEHGKQHCPHAHRSGKHGRKPLLLRCFVAFDVVDKRHVLLTFVRKASASGKQIDHVRRAMLTLSRANGFQRLFTIWEQEECEYDNESLSSWVFVQEFQLSWIPLDLYCEANEFTESILRRVTCDVVSMVHFLHTHEFTASGQLCANQDFMVNLDTQRVVWLVSPALVLSGCLLAHATPGRRSRDVSSIGHLMFHLSMVPHASTLLELSSDTEKLELLIRRKLRHLSPACRGLMIFCLTEKPTIEQLVKRKWLRHIEFVSVVPRLNYHIDDALPHTRFALRSLLWKLTTFFKADWMGHVHALGATPTATASSLDEEDAESPRRVKKSSTKRQYVGRHVSFSSNSYPHPHQHHFGRAGVVGGNMLMRGMVIVPPLGSAIFPHIDEEDEDKYRSGQLGDLQSHSFIVRGAESTIFRGTGEILYEVDSKASGDLNTLYDSFTYNFRSSPISPLPLPEYDAFEDEENDVFSVEASALDGEIIEDGEGRRVRVGSLLAHENGHNQSLHSAASISDMRSVLRSLHPSTHSSSHSGSDERAELQQFDSAIQAKAFSNDGLDPVHLSAFGPSDISFRETFRIDIWAYLRQQRHEMLETALEMNDSEVGQRVQPMQIARGTLVTVSIEPSNQFSVLGDDCKSFRWRGEVNGVSFEMQHKRSNRQREELDETEGLCIARIVAGTKVSLLFIRLKATGLNAADASTPTVLSTRLEHLAADVPSIMPQSLEPVRSIGKGAFGEAMLAIWKEHNTHVVIKSPHHDALQADRDTVDEFRHEAAVMQMLGKHPHVVELLGVTAHQSMADDFSAIVTEYLPNGSLHEFLTTSAASHTPTNPSAPLSPTSFEPLSLFSRTVMVRDAAHGIVNIHQGHVLHRDIAARNCLLDEQYRVKVCDFGMSRLSSKTNCLFFDDEHHGFGPIKWMAPESVLPPHLFSTHSDSYMFGVLMYEVFSGQLPFPGISSRDAMKLILEGQHISIPEYLPYMHQQLMKRCFDPHPLARPSMDEIFTTLDQWILQDTQHHSRMPITIL